MDLLGEMLDAAQPVVEETVKAPEPPAASADGSVGSLLEAVLDETAAPSAGRDPYGLGVYDAPAPRVVVQDAPAAPVNLSSKPAASLDRVQSKMRQAFRAPTPVIDGTALDRSGVSIVHADGTPGILCAGLLKSGDRVKVVGEETYVTLGRQLAPGRWTVLAPGSASEATQTGVCPGTNHCRTDGWAPGTPQCKGWRGRSR